MTTFRKFDWNRARSDFSTLFTDFHDYVAADWVITTTEAGAGDATEAVGNLAGGVLVVTNDAADDDKDFFQWAGNKGAVAETFKFVSGKKLQFVFRGKLSDATQCDFFAGLYITDTDPVGGLSDGIYFRKLDGSTTLYLVAEKDSTETTLAVATLANDTYVVLEFYYDGGDRISAYVSGSRVGSIAVTTAPDDEELALSFGIQNGEAAAKVLSVDYIGASQER